MQPTEPCPDEIRLVLGYLSDQIARILDEDA
jgi:hypothetical protein